MIVAINSVPMDQAVVIGFHDFEKKLKIFSMGMHWGLILPFEFG